MRDFRAYRQGWECVRETYGCIYSWGRGGRTLAPEALVRTRGGSCFSIPEKFDTDSPRSEMLETIHIVESFNGFVQSWCRDVPNMWNDYYNETWGKNVPTEDVAELSVTD